jgi:DNA modification methylase
MHADRVEMIALADLKDYGQNPMSHPEDQLEAFADVVTKFGWTTPLLVDEANEIIAGHGRKIVAQRKGVDPVPCVRLVGLSAEQKRALRIADNALARRGVWDLDRLLGEIGALKDGGMDLALTGFTDAQLGEFGIEGFALDARLKKAEETPPLPPSAVVKKGELWSLGRHRLLIGDSTSRVDVSRLLGPTKPHLMVTDPPYGVDYDPSWRARAGVADGSKLARGKVQNDDTADWRAAWALFPGSVAYVWHSALHGREVEASLEAVKFKVRAQIVWVKHRPVIGRGNYHWQHEPAFYATQKGKKNDRWQDRFEDEHELLSYEVREGETAQWQGSRKQSTVWFVENQKNETGHGTQKPIECMRRPVLNNSKLGDAVYEPFSGSGTTLIACEMEGRVCYAMEIDPAYAQVTIERWQNFTGKEAHRADGKRFAELFARKRRKA